jgi:hypothetical protein
LNIYKTSNECFFSKESHQGFLTRTKPAKKLFDRSSNNISGCFELERSPSRKKLYMKELERKSNVGLMLNNSKIFMNSSDKDTINSKKHYGEVKPSYEVMKFNDKQKLLPADYARLHKPSHIRLKSA